MTQFLIQYVELGVAYATLWGFLIVFLLMTVESSFIPFPSEIVMIPAGFLAYRSELFFAMPMTDLSIVIVCGTLGSLAGAYINYFLFLKLGRPFLYQYGQYFFLAPSTITRAEEIFRRYGDVTTFVCRLIPGVRQLISIPAGLSRMPLTRFALFTGLGAGLWSIILAGIGYYMASLASGMTYADLVRDGGALLHDYFPWILLGLSCVIVVYIFIHRKIMHTGIET